MKHLFHLEMRSNSMRKKNEYIFSAISEYISEYKEHNNIAPSVQEIADHVGISKATASRYLSCMREDGIIEYGGHRSISMLKSDERNNTSIKVPILGRIACGIPKFAEENIEEYVRLPTSLFGHGNYFILRANGNSMIDADIEDGDLILVRQQNYADSGQIVVALVGDEATLKRYYPEPQKKRIRLHPENCEMEDIYVDHCLIQGIATKVIKSVD